MTVKKKVKAKSKPVRKVAKPKTSIKKSFTKIKKIAAKKTVVKKSKSATAASAKKMAAEVKARAAQKRIAAPAAKPVPSGRPHKVSSSVPQRPTKAKPVVVSKSRQILTPAMMAERRAERLMRSNQTFSYMKAPGHDHAFEVGDIVEVFCDHEKNRERVRGWVRGIVVQVDHKMVAVQFRSNVFLTDGWMVPDRILWYPLTSDQIRSTDTKKAVAVKKEIPDY